jgi:hypothetical protein
VAIARTPREFAREYRVWWEIMVCWLVRNVEVEAGHVPRQTETERGVVGV